MEQERLRAIWARTVEKLQEVVREFKITEDELHEAGAYLDRLGRSGMCRSLIDVGLAMTSVDVVAGVNGGTRPNLEGPYYAAHPLRPDGNLIEREPPSDAARLTLHGIVTDAATGKPISGARLDFWQADSAGLYDRKGSHLRGIVIADAAGRYQVTTVLPNDYSEHDQDPIGELFRAMGRPNTRAAHIHVKVSVDGQLRLTTQLFMPTSRFLERDYVEGAVSDDLIVKLEPDAVAPGGAKTFRARFDIAVVTRFQSTAA
jgi:protocatechuate 3,4-dioxygenase beta subunit